MSGIEIFLSYFKIIVLRRMHYRMAYMLSTMGRIIKVVIMMVFFKYLYGQTQAIANFTYSEVLVLLGVSTAVISLFAAFFGTGAPAFVDMVIDGRIELYMVRPINWRVLPMAKSANIYNFFSFIFGIYIIYIGMVRGDMHISFILLICVAISFMLSVYSIYIFQSVVCAIGMRVRVGALSWIFWDLTDFSRYPYTIVPGMVFYILSVIPVMGISAFPACILTGKWPLYAFFVQILLLLPLIIVNSALWKMGERLYESTGTVK